MSSDSGPKRKVGVLAEKEEYFASYSAASVASCDWVNSGRDKIDPSELELYSNESKPGIGKVVGVGLQGTSTVIPYVRLDMDITGKGIHFNATQLSDTGTSKKLAAVLTSSVNLTDAQRTTLYLDYIKGLENRSAEFIWEWWSTGIPPS